MDKEQIKKLAGNPNFIKGIYNYCDRWCERCPFTSRCMNFALADEQFPDQESHDIDNEAFWHKLSEIFRVTLDLVKETAEQAGIDLDAINTEETAEKERLNGEIVRSHECCRMAKAYAKMVDNCFDSLEGAPGHKENDLTFKARVEILNADPLQETDNCENAVEVIRWYQHQIYVKLMRAIRGILEEKDEPPDEFAKDSDGSAKVALIGIDRSIAAWGEIRTCFFAYESEILDILVHLERLRRNVEKVFPDARAFIRPGFDKVDLNS
ncbi:MAG: hypothetical protein JRE23_00875 [Deltaproteobacteria bacterium]|nr:hypothetical protein [Deltaproteobacteria bacterium]